MPSLHVAIFIAGETYAYQCMTFGRYAIQLISVATIVCKKRKGNEITMPDVRRVYSLFVDEIRSCQFLTDYQNEFMFNEVDSTEASETDKNDGTSSMETS